MKLYYDSVAEMQHILLYVAEKQRKYNSGITGRVCVLVNYITRPLSGDTRKVNGNSHWGLYWGFI